MNPLYRTACIDHHYFSSENLHNHPERFVVIGFIAADGCISNPSAGQARLQFNISKKDRCVLEMINKEIAKNGRKLSLVKKTKSLILYFPSDQICHDLRPFNIVPRKTATYSLPYLSDRKMRYFLRGYFYGDGCIHGNRGARIYHIIGNTNFCSQLRKFLLDKKIVESCKIYPCHNPKYSNIIMKGRQGAKFSRYIISDDKLVLLPRKHILTFELIKGSLWRGSDMKILRSHVSLKVISKLTRRPISACRAKTEKMGIKRHGDILQAH